VYYLALMQLLSLLLFLFLVWQAVGYYRKMRLWKRVSSMPFPESYETALGRIPHYRLLPDDLKRRLRPKILYFSQTKEFVGIKTEVTDEMRAVISFYACLMVLNIPGECYEELSTILIYPYDVVAKEIRENGGIYAEERLILEGQSAGDTVVIAWNEARRQAYHLRHHNVIIHELAHVLDFENGAADGVPPLERSRYHRWTRVLYRRFKELRERAGKNREWADYKLIGAYAATDEAEFFAVVTELFFQRPKTLKTHFPDIYEELAAFYGLDTAKLFESLD
jgi:Mlc titration factor MtfA (ptsG expression regulator)